LIINGKTIENDAVLGHDEIPLSDCINDYCTSRRRNINFTFESTEVFYALA
jgi:hypothetical protein